MVENTSEKPDHVLLADFADSFTSQILGLAMRSLKDPDIEKPSFMRAVSGTFSVNKGRLQYRNEQNRWFIVPANVRNKVLDINWKIPHVPRGQQSFYNYIRNRYIGIQQKRHVVNRCCHEITQPVDQLSARIVYFHNGANVVDMCIYEVIWMYIYLLFYNKLICAI